MKERLAEPASMLRDEPVIVEDAPEVEPAFAEAAIPKLEATVEKAPTVGAAIAGGGTYQPKNDDSAKTKKKNGISSLSVAELRQGADFESFAAIVAGPTDRFWYQKMFAFIFEERNFMPYGEAKRYIVLRGGCCFVFTDEYSTSPLYTFCLQSLVPELEDRNNPHPKTVTISPEANTNISNHTLQTVLLKRRRRNNNHTKIDYQLTFRDDEDGSGRIVDRFCKAVCLPQPAVEVEEAILMADVASMDHKSNAKK